jgi:hypothetical protein
MEKKIFEVLRLIDREVAKLEIDNVQLSHFQNPNPKGKEIDRLKTIAQMLEGAIS